MSKVTSYKVSTCKIGPDSGDAPMTDIKPSV